MAKKTLKLPYWIGDYVYWQDLYENKISSGIISKIVIYGYDIYYYAYDVSVNLLVRLPPEKIYSNYKAIPDKGKLKDCPLKEVKE